MDNYLCLTPNQTISFLVNDLDPGTTEYPMAVSMDGRGCPIGFNYLIGDEYVKLASGHTANLGAQAISALAGGFPACDEILVTAALTFNGISCARVPATLALSNTGSKTDGNDTMLILNRIGGNMATGAATLGTIFGQMYDSAENGASFTLTGAASSATCCRTTSRASRHASGSSSQRAEPAG